MDPLSVPVRIVIVGHVDHGKSTLVGRLLNDTGSLPEGRVEQIRSQCAKRGMPFEWSFLLDALQAERDQGITIDTTQIWFKTNKRDYVIIDAPGHKEFLKNMVTGAASADAALLLIDGAEGVQEQTHRHGYLLHLMGIRQVAVIVNKMDLVDYSETRFAEIEADYRHYLGKLGINPIAFIPAVARAGESIVARTPSLSWFPGPTVVEAIDQFRPLTYPQGLPLRFPIQDVYKFDDRRIFAGRIESGSLKVGDRLLFSPSNKTARVKSIEAWNTAHLPSKAEAGESVGITLDEPLFLERGDWASHETDAPVETDVCRARLFWLGHNPLKAGSRYKFKLATTEAIATVQSIDHVIDVTGLAPFQASEVPRNSVAEITLRFSRIVALDEYSHLPFTGRFVLVDGYEVAGGGNLSMEGYADQRGLITRRATNVRREEHHIRTEERERRNGHRGGVIWLTGLSGAGKSTLALALERELFNRGRFVYVLDGDNVRHGLNADLSFSPEDRAENIRRVGEVAALMARAGMIVVTAFISPYRSDRDRARAAMPDGFHEVYIKASLETCEQRDPKGLYKKARAGEIGDFTGISAPYEPPGTPELVVDTDHLSVSHAVESLVDYVETKLAS